MAATVTVAIDGGALLVEDGVLHLGELAPIAFTGYEPAEGNTVRLTLFDRDGKTPLADNHADAAVMDLRGERLRKAFHVERCNKVFYATATEYDGNGDSTGEVLATGQVPVAWSPLVFDAATGEPASLKGDKGDKGDPLTWDDLTPEQKASLKGDKGDPLTWDDLTPEQKASLKGPKGDKGAPGISGADSDVKGEYIGTYIPTDHSFGSVDAGYLHPDGTVYTPEGTPRGVTDYIELNGRTITVASGVVALGDGLTYACFYDQAANFLSALTRESPGNFTGDITIPSGAKYIRFTLADAEVPASVTMYDLYPDVVRKPLYRHDRYLNSYKIPSAADGYLKPNGTVYTPEGTPRGVTDYIEVAGKTITVASGVVALGDGLTYACFYDANKELVSALTRESPGDFTGNITIPAGAKYIRFTLGDATVPAVIDMFAALQDMPFSGDDTMSLVDRLGEQLGERKEVSFEVEAVFKGMYVKADGTEGSSATRACTDYLIVNNDRRIAFTGATGSIADSGYCYGCVYDAEKNFIQPILAAAYTQGNYLTLPPEARYIRLNVAKHSSKVTITQSGYVGAKGLFKDVRYFDNYSIPSAADGYLKPNGTVYTPEGTPRGVTDYIEVAGKTITVVSGVVAVNDGLTYACFYDANRELVSALTKESWGSFTGNITIPSGAKYIRFTLSDADVPAVVNICLPIQDMAFDSEDTMSLVNWLGNQLGARTEVSNEVDAVFKGMYVKADGTEGSSATRACTDYLIVNNDRRIAFTGAFGGIADSGYCFGCVYDAAKNFIQPILAADYTQGDYLTLPPEARYIRLNVETLTSKVTIKQNGFVGTADKINEFNFLLIGSSYGLCSVLQFPFLVADAGIRITCGNLYKSGVGLPTIAEQIENETENGWDKGMIFTNEAGEWVSATTDLDTMLRAKKWDCISIQRSAADKKTWNAAQEAALETIIGHIRDVCGEEGARPQIVLNTIFAAEEFSTDKQSQCNETMEIVNTALAIKKRFGIDITNVAMTVQNVRLTACATYGSAPDTTFHDLACDDNGHLDYGVGSYVAGLALFEQLILPRFGKSVLCVEKVASLSDLSSTGVVPANKYTAPDSAFKSIAKICALVTWGNPYEISTGLAHAYPTTPETVVQPGRNAMLGYVGAQPTLSPAQLANIAAVSDALAFDATHSYAAGDPVVYNGTLYTFTAAHTGAWTGSDVSAVDIIAILAALRTALAGKADASSLATVATSGSYNDLEDKPTIPTVPTALPNPNALSIGSGSGAVQYTGAAAVSLVPGQNVTMTNNNGVVTIAAAGGGGMTGFSLTVPWGIGNGYPVKITLDDSTVVTWSATATTSPVIKINNVSYIPYLINSSNFSFSIFLPCKRARFQALSVYDSNFPYVSVNGDDLSYRGNADFTLNFTDANNYICYANGTCLAYGTQIALADGSFRAVEDIRVGDRVLALDENGNEVEDVVTECTGEAGLVGVASDIWRFDDGTKVTTVGRHRFYNADLGEFMYLEAWNIGEHARLRDGRLVALVDHKRIEGEARHATLFTKRYNTYFANGMLCGNRRSVKVK